jgi:hypothetical protein
MERLQQEIPQDQAQAEKTTAELQKQDQVGCWQQWCLLLRWCLLLHVSMCQDFDSKAPALETCVCVVCWLLLLS